MHRVRVYPGDALGVCGVCLDHPGGGGCAVLPGRHRGFAGATNFETHAGFGYTISFVMLFGLVLAVAARLPWRTIGLTALLPVLVGLQSLFIAFWRSGLTNLAALLVINGLAIFALSGLLALRSHGYVAVRALDSAAVDAPAQ